jgi:branched-chain amino acid aminotransferase
MKDSYGRGRASSSKAPDLTMNRGSPAAGGRSVWAWRKGCVMDIAVRTDKGDSGKAKSVLAQELGFGRFFADRMFLMRYTVAKGWHDSEIVSYGPLPLDPAAMVLHYGQEIFEGQKAYLWPDGRIGMFRPEANAARLNRSAKRMCMPEIPDEVQLAATLRLVGLLRDWVPTPPSALYVRPTLIASEAALGVRAATEYLYFIICSPVGPYFPKGFAPVRVRAEEQYVRAVEGGTGAAKAGGNYAGSLAAQAEAKKQGYDGNLWLDAIEHRFVEEMGAMNIFFVLGGKIVTSPLRGTILPGVTRDSILRLTRDEGREVEERRVSIEELAEAAVKGTLTEAFAAGTAAVVTPVGTIGWRGNDLTLGDGQPGPVTRHVYQTLTDIQYGRASDPYQWMTTIE